MREIKFRAWNVKSQVMVDDFVISPTGKKLTHNGNLLYEGVYETKLELMQFTGLLDKQGKEIYEGDIVKLDGDEILSTICWDNENAKFVNVELAFGGEYSVDTSKPAKDHNKLEVIGNIHESPDLLTNKEQK